MPLLVDGYLQWKYGSTVCTEDGESGLNEPGHVFDVAVVNTFSKY